MEKRVTKQCILCNQEGHHYNECRLFYTTLCDGMGIPAILNTEEETRQDRAELQRIPCPQCGVTPDVLARGGSHWSNCPQYGKRSPVSAGDEHAKG